MATISIYTLTSNLHDEEAVRKSTEQFLSSLDIEYQYCGNDFTTYGDATLSLIYVRTGGTENAFLELLPQLRKQSSQPFYLLTSGKSNSLAASLEILSYLQANELKGEVLHGRASYVKNRIELLACVEAGKKALKGVKVGVIGKPSDWLISSMVDYAAIEQKLGIKFVQVDMQEVKAEFEKVSAQMTEEVLREELARYKEKVAPICKDDAPGVERSLTGALHMYHALKNIVAHYGLQAFTIRCFDLLTAYHNTGCLALARLNEEGIVAGCEGDVPTLLSMLIVKSLTGVSGFQANPSQINAETGDILFAHCTIPLNMVNRYELDTHFESSIGVGIRGYMQEGFITIFKVSPAFDRYFAAEGQLEHNSGDDNLCRTQQHIRLNRTADARYFLTQPIGNHHVIVPGHVKELLEEFMR